jgi:D-glycero-D-manno-heptose 1,7-bisphosphate phosphatase
VSGDRRAVLLDRDGVITRRRDDYVKSWDEVEVLPGAAEAVARLCEAGYRVGVVTNQSAIGRGLMSMDTLDAIHRSLDAVVGAAGGAIDVFVVCPHRPDDGCECRKPRPGLLLRAGLRLGVDLAATPMVGDQPSDLAAALAAGCRPILVGAHDAASPGWAVAADLAAAVDLILTQAN